MHIGWDFLYQELYITITQGPAYILWINMTKMLVLLRSIRMKITGKSMEGPQGWGGDNNPLLLDKW